MRSGWLWCLPTLVACSTSVAPNLGADGGYTGTCLAQTPAASLYSAECQPPQVSTFCLVAETTNF